MKIHVFNNPPPEAIGIALETFEAQFRYPLGPHDSFSISHGRRYTTFFEAIGEPTLIIAMRDDVVLGTLAAALRPLSFPDSSVRDVAYLGDLKVVPSARSGVVLARMFQRMRELMEYPASGLGYAVVMDGTERTPPAYTGRLKIPEFAQAGRISVLKIAAVSTPHDVREICCEEMSNISESLLPGRFRPCGGRAELRSSISPVCFATADQAACGRLEDTRLAKRLLLPEGAEIHAAHLSKFTYRTPHDGAAFLRSISARCATLGIPSFFTAVPSSSLEELIAALNGIPIVVAPATVYSCGFRNESAADWLVDTAEI